MTTKNKLPLEQYTVLDLTIARAGPVAVRLLSDWGAKVIKIEPPLKSTGSDSVTGKDAARTNKIYIETSEG